MRISFANIKVLAFLILRCVKLSLKKDGANKLLDKSKNPLAKQQQDELIAVTNLKYAKQRLHLKTKYLSLCQRYMLKLDSKVASFSNKEGKGVVRNPEPLSMAASERVMRRWNTKRFQKRRNLPQQSRRILKAWIDDHIEHLTLLIAKSSRRSSKNHNRASVELVCQCARPLCAKTTESPTRYVTTLKS